MKYCLYIKVKYYTKRGKANQGTKYTCVRDVTVLVYFLIFDLEIKH